MKSRRLLHVIYVGNTTGLLTHLNITNAALGYYLPICSCFGRTKLKVKNIVLLYNMSQKSTKGLKLKIPPSWHVYPSTPELSTSPLHSRQ